MYYSAEGGTKSRAELARPDTGKEEELI